MPQHDATPTAKAASAEPTASAASSDAETEIDLQFHLASDACIHIEQERSRALTELDLVLRQHTEQVPTSVLAELGKVALDLATDQIGGKIVQLVAQPVKGVIQHKVFDGTKNATHVRVERTNQQAHAFVQLQQRALNEAQKVTLDRLARVNADMKIDLHHHPKKKDATVSHARSIAHAFNNRDNNVFQVQYNISLAKWFSALSQSSFGANPNHKHASNLGQDKLASGPVSGVRSNFEGREYLGKQGFVHLELFVSHEGRVKATKFSTPGIDPKAWSHRDPAGSARGEDPQLSKPLGELALNDLVQGVHLPVIADVKFHFNPTDGAVKQHFPTGFAPIAISWNEADIISVELASKGDDFPITDADRRFLGRSFAHALKQPDSNAAAKWLIKTKIGNHGMGLLRATVGSEIK